ncbi:MAG: hypothetical protein ACOC1K_04770 [Nanoarchaeota archaeon]
MSESKYTIDVNQAKEVLGVSRKTIYNRLKSGELDGKKVPTDNTMKWLINEESIQKARCIKESVEVREVKQPIDKEQFLQELTESIQGNIGSDIEQVEDNLKETIERQNERLQEDIQKLTDQVQELKEHQNKSLWDKIKKIFQY